MIIEDYSSYNLLEMITEWDWKSPETLWFELCFSPIMYSITGIARIEQSDYLYFI